MSYRPIDTETRINIVKQYWVGCKIATLARQFQVSRDSIHIWINKAEEALMEALSANKPGPKKDMVNQLTKEKAELEKINKQLLKELEDLSQKISLNSNVAVEVNGRRLALRPSSCPSCGCNVIWRNGTYIRKGSRVQRFRCSTCDTKIDMEVVEG